MTAPLTTRLRSNARIEWRHVPSPRGFVPSAEVAPFLVIRWPSGRETALQITHEEATRLEATEGLN